MPRTRALVLPLILLRLLVCRIFLFLLLLFLLLLLLLLAARVHMAACCPRRLPDPSFTAICCFSFSSCVSCASTYDLLFDAVRPRVDVCQVTNPHAFAWAAYRGLYYVTIVKYGTVASATNKRGWLWRPCE